MRSSRRQEGGSWSAGRNYSELKPHSSLLLPLSHSARSFVLSLVFSSQNQSVSNVSILLDNLLQDYDNSLRPDFGGHPTIITEVLFWGTLKDVQNLNADVQTLAS